MDMQTIFLTTPCAANTLALKIHLTHGKIERYDERYSIISLDGRYTK